MKNLLRAYLWILAGGLWALVVLGAASIGLFVLPLAVLATVFASRRARETQPVDVACGLTLGVAFVVVTIGVGNMGNQSCDEQPSRPDRGTIECGGPDGELWLAVGFLLALTAVLIAVREARVRLRP